MLLPTISAACSAAEPCHTPSTRVGRPSTAAASGTVASISTVPGRNDGFSCFSNSACPANGTVSTTMSDILTAVVLSAPSTLPRCPTFSAICAAVALARSASREPMITDSGEGRAIELLAPQPPPAPLAAGLAEPGEGGPAGGAIFAGAGHGSDGTAWG